jgi:hypothetical protein
MTDMTTSQSLNDISKIELDPNLIQERESWEILDISPPKQSSQSSQSSQTPRNSPEDALLPLPLPLLPPPPPAYPAPSKDDYYIDIGGALLDSTYRCRRSSGVEYIFTESKPHPIAIFRDGALEWIDQSAHLQHMLETYEILKNENKILKQKNKYCIDTLDILEKKAIKYEMLYLKEKVRNYEEQFMSSSDEEFVFSDDSGEDY